MDDGADRGRGPLGRRGLLRASGVAGLAALLAAGRQQVAHAEPLGCSAHPPAPVPPGAAPPPVPFGGYRIDQLGPALYTVSDGSAIAAVLTTDRRVVVVDAPNSATAVLPTAIQEISDRPVTHLIYSHAHADHIGAAAAVAPDARFVGHRLTADLLRGYRDPARPVPQLTFTDRRRLTFEGEVVELAYRGNNHTPGNSFIHFPHQRALMLVDIVWPGWVPFTQLGYAEDVPGYLAAHDHALEYDVDHVITGHFRNASRTDLLTNQEYLADVIGAGVRALQDVSVFAIGQQTGFENTWYLLDTYFDTLVATAAAPVVRRWVDRLGGADIWTPDACLAIIQALRIDDLRLAV